MARSLPVRPSLTHLKHEAKAILRAQRAGDRACCAVLRNLKTLAAAPDERILGAQLSLTEVQHALASDYGYPSWAKLKKRVEKTAPPMQEHPAARWYHGSPKAIDELRAGSTVTPIPQLARAFAHRPGRLDINIRENDETHRRTVTIEHDGKSAGFLYEVAVADPARDLRPHPESTLAPGEEMLTTRPLPLRMLESLRADEPARQEFDDPSAG
jgi:hypothetical protein